MIAITSMTDAGHEELSRLPRAACAEVDSELFFPDGDGSLALLQISEAKGICRGCPLILSCLQGALERDEFGVWDGTDDDERARMKRPLARHQASAAA
ncbi:WhiB family transcriptional regulator [Streptomyces sp. NPDC058268]|uniref:WhiB family transcriptional regulator n=1 Tax=Streptomyces sp. NPDC058268 TaxID=3346413 RepID=UPI0036E27545